MGWAGVPLDFSARYVIALIFTSDGYRFSTKTRSYKYLFFNTNNYLNIEKMSQSAKSLEGEHDFRNFCKLDVNATHWVRKIHSVHITPFSTTTSMSGEELKTPSDSAICYVCTIVGSGFLWHQIRCIMYLLFLVGTGKEDPSVCAPHVLIFIPIRLSPTFWIPRKILVNRPTIWHQISLSSYFNALITLKSTSISPTVCVD